MSVRKTIKAIIRLGNAWDEANARIRRLCHGLIEVKDQSEAVSRATNSLGCVAARPGGAFRLYWRAHFNDRLIRVRLVAYESQAANDNGEEDVRAEIIILYGEEHIQRVETSGLLGTRVMDTTTPDKGAAVIRHLERLVAILRTPQTTTTKRTGT